MMRPPYAYSSAGESDAWTRSGTSRPLTRHDGSDAGRPLDGGRSLRRNSALPSRPAAVPARPLTNAPCGVEDFRALARTIERRRQLDPLSRPAAPAPRPAGQAAPVSSRWINEVRPATDVTFTHRKVAGGWDEPRTSDRRSENRAIRLDADEFARLESVLEDVLGRLRALEQKAGTHQARSREPVPSAVEARAQRREAAPQRESSFRHRETAAERTAQRPPVTERASASGRRPEPQDTRRTEDHAGARPRRLWR